jgi:hypothetical protein
VGTNRTKKKPRAREWRGGFSTHGSTGCVASMSTRTTPLRSHRKLVFEEKGFRVASTLLCEAGRASSFSSNRVSCGFRAAWICSRCSRRISFQSYCLPSRRNKRRHGDRPQERRNIWRSEKLQRRERGNPGSRDQNKRREDRRGRNSAGRACDRCMRAGPSRELPDRAENTPISLRP